MPTAVAPTANVIEVDGTALAAEIAAQLESAIVTDRLSAPDTFALLFADPTRDILSRAGLEIGKKVAISTTSTTFSPPGRSVSTRPTSRRFPPISRISPKGDTSRPRRPAVSPPCGSSTSSFTPRA